VKYRDSQEIPNTQLNFGSALIEFNFRLQKSLDKPFERFLTSLQKKAKVEAIGDRK